MQRCWIAIVPLCFSCLAFAQTETKLTAADATAYDSFGSSVSVNSDTAVVGAWGGDVAGTSQGVAYVYTRDDGGTWSEQAKLIASDGEFYDNFGCAVSVDGDTVVIGAYLDDGDVGIDQGSAYVYTRDAAGTWSEQAKLTASDAAAEDRFGFSVSINSDSAVIGAVWDDHGGGTDYGSVYVFSRDAGGTWSEQVKLTASDAASEDWFAWSVSVDGDTAMVGAPFDDDDGIASGSAYVFTGAPIPVELQSFTVE
jgi:hypothetical protein